MTNPAKQFAIKEGTATFPATTKVEFFDGLTASTPDTAKLTEHFLLKCMVTSPANLRFNFDDTAAFFTVEIGSVFEIDARVLHIFLKGDAAGALFEILASKGV